MRRRDASGRRGENGRGASAFTAEAARVLGPHLVERHFARGHLLWSEGDRDGMLVHLRRGRVKIYRLLPTGRAITLFVFGAGTLFGFMPFLDERPYPAYAQAMEDCEAEIMPRSALNSIVQREPEVALFLLRHLSRRLREAFETIERLSSRGSLPKVAAALVALLPPEGPVAGIRPELRLPVSAQEFASALGITPETLSRNLTELVSQGVIERSGRNRFHVHDLDRLQQLAASTDLIC